MTFTFSTAVTVSFAKALKAIVFTPAAVLISVVTWVLIKLKSAVLVKSRDLSATLALTSVRFATFVFTTSTTELSAALKASTSLAPAPSADAANAVTTFTTC